MQLRTLRVGSHNNDGLVLALEEFLRDEGWYWVEADGVFNDDTDLAVKQFQKEHGLSIDGKVGRNTWGKILGQGFHAIELEASEDWPARPTDYTHIPYGDREKYFGHIAYVAAGNSTNPEAIRVTNSWVKDNIVTHAFPQLKGISGVPWQGQMAGAGPKGGRIQLHKDAVAPMEALLEAWEDAGLLGNIITWLGMLCMRFTRGSRSTLSNHSYGTAFDINASWNGLRKTPALKGQRGCVRELIEVAMQIEVNGWGWWWGGWGWFPNFDKLDGMHLELCRK